MDVNNANSWCLVLGILFALFVEIGIIRDTLLNAAHFSRTRTVVGNRRGIANGNNIETVVRKRSNSRIASTADAFHDNLDINRTGVLQTLG